MNKIKILDESVSNIIAAGEVVENPASMIKELIENSLDAGATVIKIDVKNSGRDVKISDTGIGMEKEDLFLCVERHATSKIHRKNDIFNLTSYGFRGEALASIGSISKMIISTKTSNSGVGHKINLLAGKITKYEEISKNTGTEIIIKDLFYNTPARLKFLRKKSTEYGKIREIVLKEALYNTKVSFSLLLDGREVIKTSGTKIENTILELFGRNTLKNITKFPLGFWGNMEILKSNKESIYTYVNGRYVKSKTIEKAVLDSYYTKLVKGKYPFAIIFYEISPDLVDVNVHPSKKVVKFVNEEEVYKDILDNLTEAIYKDDRKNSIDISVEEDLTPVKKDDNLESTKKIDLSQLENLIGAPKALPKQDAMIKNKVIKTEQPSLDIPTPHLPSNMWEEEKLENLENKVEERIKKAARHSEQYEIMNPDTLTPPTREKEKKQSTVAENIVNENIENKGISKSIKYRIIGQLHNMYILVETDNELEIYDQHIVHERILYEKLKEIHYNKKISIQNLLVPIKLELTGYEFEIVRENLELFNEFGFKVEEFGDNEILIRGIPIFNFRVSVEETFRYLLENLGGGDPREKVIISMSCRNAIKAGEKLTLEEMEKLIGELHEIGKYTCPHGRPIILKMSFNEMDKKFNRK